MQTPQTPQRRAKDFNLFPSFIKALEEIDERALLKLILGPRVTIAEFIFVNLRAVVGKNKMAARVSKTYFGRRLEQFE